MAADVGDKAFFVEIIGQRDGIGRLALMDAEVGQGLEDLLMGEVIEVVYPQRAGHVGDEAVVAQQAAEDALLGFLVVGGLRRSLIGFRHEASLPGRDSKNREKDRQPQPYSPGLGRGVPEAPGQGRGYMNGEFTSFRGPA